MTFTDEQVETIDELIVAAALAIPNGGRVVDAADELIAEVLSQRDDWSEWIYARAVELIKRRMSEALRSHRAAAFHQEGRRAFGDYVEDLRAGKARKPSTYFDVRFDVSDIHERKRFGAMNRPEVLYVADNFGKDSRRMAFWEAFLTAVAKKLPDNLATVEETFSLEEIGALRQKFFGDTA